MLVRAALCLEEQTDARRPSKTAFDMCLRSCSPRSPLLIPTSTTRTTRTPQHLPARRGRRSQSPAAARCRPCSHPTAPSATPAGTHPPRTPAGRRCAAHHVSPQPTEDSVFGMGDRPAYHPAPGPVPPPPCDPVGPLLLPPFPWPCPCPWPWPAPSPCPCSHPFPLPALTWLNTPTAPSCSACCRCRRPATRTRKPSAHSTTPTSSLLANTWAA